MANTTNFGWETPDDTDLVKDGALAIRTLANAIDTSLADLEGGTTGQVLAKNSNTDMDFIWVAQDDSNAIQNAIIDAKGDLIVGTAADTPARLASSASNGNVLTVDTSTATGLKWAAPAGGGKVLQVLQQVYTTETTNSTTTMADTGMAQSITPSSASSKVLIMAFTNWEKTGASGDNGVRFQIVRDATTVHDTYIVGYQGQAQRLLGTHTQIYLDSPNTTSAITYKLQFRNFHNGAAVITTNGGLPSTFIVMEIGA